MMSADPRVRVMVLCVPTGRHGRDKHLGEMRLSVHKKVLLLDLNAVVNQKLPILLCKCLATMVLFLLGDIPHYLVFVAQIV